MAEALAQPKKRIDSIDILRGVVMVVMALDHTRDFFTRIDYDPTDLSKATTALFLTRFITHYCAATFVFLAGTSAFLSLSRGKTKGEAARFLVSRGLWLILLEVTLVNWGFGNFHLDFSFVMLQVIWVTGLSMVILAGLIYLPVWAIATFGLVLIFGHNAFDNVDPKSIDGAGGVVWQFLHVKGMVNYASGQRQIFVLYPLIPWVGLMAAGYSFGTLFKMEQAMRKKILVAIGCSAIVLFIIIRSFNIYGDPNHWTDQGVWHRTVLSFINAQKYPPSLDYLLITLGPAILLLANLEDVKGKIADIFLVYGRVPLFYYLCHLYLLELLAFITGFVCTLLKIPVTNGFSFSLSTVYAYWLLAVFILYFPCRGYMRYKATHKQWWLSYI